MAFAMSLLLLLPLPYLLECGDIIVVIAFVCVGVIAVVVVVVGDFNDVPPPKPNNLETGDFRLGDCKCIERAIGERICCCCCCCCCLPAE